MDNYSFSPPAKLPSGRSRYADVVVRQTESRGRWRKFLVCVGFAGLFQYGVFSRFHRGEDDKASEMDLLHVKSLFKSMAGDEVVGDKSMPPPADQQQQQNGKYGRDDAKLQQQASETLSSSPTRLHAYAFLIAGCDPDNRDYHGYLYNILSSAHILKESGSKADVVALVRLASKSRHTSLPAEEEEWLRKCGVILKYLDKIEDEKSDSFYTAMLAKFNVLDLTDYSRVIFLDSDAMPICNLDYVFDLSEGDDAILKENLVIAWKTEPSQGGFFMLKPGPGELEELQQVIATREEKAKKLPWPPFDEVEGWGHVIKPPDRWQNFNGHGGTKWNWYGVFADQGLLYQWTKYVKKTVSIIVDDEVQNWGPAEKNDTQSVRLESKTRGIMDEKSCSSKDPFGRGRMLYHAPYRDFNHFVSRSKPWLGGKASNVPDDVTHISEAKTPTQLWFHGIRRQIAEHNLSDSIDIYNLRVGKPPLGLFPTWWEMYLQANVTKANGTESSATVTS